MALSQYFPYCDCDCLNIAWIMCGLNDLVVGLLSLVLQVPVFRVLTVSASQPRPMRYASMRTVLVVCHSQVSRV